MLWHREAKGAGWPSGRPDLAALTWTAESEVETSRRTAGPRGARAGPLFESPEDSLEQFRLAAQLLHVVLNCSERFQTEGYAWNS